MIKTTAEGWSVIEGDTHHAKWVEECRNIVHDPFMANICKSLVVLGKDSIDVGANIGTLTIRIAEASTGDSVVWAIDPNIHALQCVDRNASQARLKNKVEVIHGAAWAYDSRAKLVMSENVGASFITPVAKGGTVPLFQIDELILRNHAAVGFIKIDAEGSELMALLGARRVIIEQRPNLMVEVNHGALEAVGRSINVEGYGRGSLLSFLSTFYKNVKIAQNNCTWESEQYDVICTP